MSWANEAGTVPVEPQGRLRLLTSTLLAFQEFFTERRSMYRTIEVVDLSL
jgi:hypothetical protein